MSTWMGQARAQVRTRLPRLAENAVERARLTVVPRGRTRAPRMPFIDPRRARPARRRRRAAARSTPRCSRRRFKATALETQADPLHARSSRCRWSSTSSATRSGSATRAQSTSAWCRCSTRRSSSSPTARSSATPLPVNPLDAQRLTPLPTRAPAGYDPPPRVEIAEARRADGVPSDDRGSDGRYKEQPRPQAPGDDALADRSRAHAAGEAPRSGARRRDRSAARPGRAGASRGQVDPAGRPPRRRVGEGARCLAAAAADRLPHHRDGRVGLRRPAVPAAGPRRPRRTPSGRVPSARSARCCRPPAARSPTATAYPLAESLDGLMIVADPTKTEGRRRGDRVDPRRSGSALDYIERGAEPAAGRTPTSATSRAASRRRRRRGSCKDLDDLGYKGLDTRRDPVRSYPGKDVAANLVGCVNAEGEAADGAELLFDALLARQGRLRDLRRRRRQPHPARRQQHHRAGRRQGPHAHHRPRRAVVHPARAAPDRRGRRRRPPASAVVMDTRTGELLALADYPTYDPNVDLEHRREAPGLPRVPRRLRAGVGARRCSRWRR